MILEFGLYVNVINEFWGIDFNLCMNVNDMKKILISYRYFY